MSFLDFCYLFVTLTVLKSVRDIAKCLSVWACVMFFQWSHRVYEFGEEDHGSKLSFSSYYTKGTCF